MFLLKLLLILFLSFTAGMFLSIIVTIHFTGIPVAMVTAVICIFGVAIVKHFYDEHNEEKKTSRIDTTIGDMSGGGGDIISLIAYMKELAIQTGKLKAPVYQNQVKEDLKNEISSHQEELEEARRESKEEWEEPEDD